MVEMIAGRCQARGRVSSAMPGSSHTPACDRDAASTTGGSGHAPLLSPSRWMKPTNTKA